MPRHQPPPGRLPSRMAMPTGLPARPPSTRQARDRIRPISALPMCGGRRAAMGSAWPMPGPRKPLLGWVEARRRPNTKIDLPRSAWVYPPPSRGVTHLQCHLAARQARTGIQTFAMQPAALLSERAGSLRRDFTVAISPLCTRGNRPAMALPSRGRRRNCRCRRSRRTGRRSRRRPAGADPAGSGPIHARL